MNPDLANLQLAVAKLHAYLEDSEALDAAPLERERVMHLVHNVSNAYLNWAFSLDNASIRVVS